jgi:hypothetical protein
MKTRHTIAGLVMLVAALAGGAALIAAGANTPVADTAPSGQAAQLVVAQDEPAVPLVVTQDNPIVYCCGARPVKPPVASDEPPLALALATALNQGDPVPLANYEHLKELDWMIGEWTRSDKDVDVRIVCSWKANKNFMSRFFTVKVKGEITHQGSQMVGWDPIQKRIRSWVFESDGTFGEGVWQRDGDRWTIKATGVLPEGKRTTATQVITKIDANQYRWQSLARAVDGSTLPNSDETILTRLSNKGKE